MNAEKNMQNTTQKGQELNCPHTLNKDIYWPFQFTRTVVQNAMKTCSLGVTMGESVVVFIAGENLTLALLRKWY